MEKLKKIIPLVLLTLLGVYFALTGVLKFTGPAWVDMFRGWGYPDGFVYLIGASEALLGIGVIISRFRAISAAGLAVIMMGASVTHMIHDSFSTSVLTIVWSAICLTVALFAYRRSAALSVKTVPQTK